MRMAQGGSVWRTSCEALSSSRRLSAVMMLLLMIAIITLLFFIICYVCYLPERNERDCNEPRDNKPVVGKTLAQAHPSWGQNALASNRFKGRDSEIDQFVSTTDDLSPSHDAC